MPRKLTLSDRKRAAILTAAEETFRTEGFYAASMDRIAERAGVSKRTVYNHFASKDVLFDVVTDQLWGQLVPSEEPPSERGATVEARLRALAHKRLGTLLQPELVKLFRAVLAETVRTPQLQRAFVGTRERFSLLGLRELLREEIERGRLQIEKLDLAAEQFWGLVLGPLFWPLVLGLRAVPDETEQKIVVGEAVKMFLAHYGPRSKRRSK